MRWNIRRQIFYASIVALFLVFLGIFVWYFFIYEPPNCTDGVMNQDEGGIDCGGACPKLCVAPRVSALWARSVRVAPGVYHAVAMVRNPESKAGTDLLPYTFSLFDEGNILVAEVRGYMTLEPGDIVPLFYRNIETGERVPTRTFVTFGNAEWHTTEKSQSPVRIVSQSLDEAALTLTATIENLTPFVQNDIVLTALMYDNDEVLLTASQTTIATLPARSSKQIVFTWQEPFGKPVLRADITAKVEAVAKTRR